MRVKLKVLTGAHSGKEITIPVPRFLIGRGEDCHLRPQSDLISRHHCEINIGEQVVVHDCGSRNGTHVNGEQIEGKHVVKMGDKLRVGALEFEIDIDLSLGGVKRSKVDSVQEAAARTIEAGAKASSKIEDDDVSAWLEEEDDAERARRMADPETRQFRLDETDKIKLKQSAEEAKESNKGKGGKKEKKKLPPGKLPIQSKSLDVNSSDAAEKMLRKFFQGPTSRG
jgi:pSer/pThr/pTyr-binding forkhead associated (FHA) protein